MILFNKPSGYEMPRSYRRLAGRRAGRGGSRSAARSLGYGRRRHNTIVQSKRVRKSMQHTGIFAPETYTTLATVDSGQDRLWVLGAVGGVLDKIAINPTAPTGDNNTNNGAWRQIDVMNATGISRHKTCPMGVYRLNGQTQSNRSQTEALENLVQLVQQRYRKQTHVQNG